MSKTKKAKENILEIAAKNAKVDIEFTEYFDNISKWTVVLKTEDERDAERYRNKVCDLIPGTGNAYGASYDDIPGMGPIHVGVMTYGDYSEATGGDVYADLDKDIRDKYTVFAVPKSTWIHYRQMTDY